MQLLTLLVKNYKIEKPAMVTLYRTFNNFCKNVSIGHLTNCNKKTWCQNYSAKKFYCMNTEIPKITSIEYEKFNTEEMLRKLTLRKQNISSLIKFQDKEVELIGWLETSIKGNVFFVDGYGKILCSFSGDQKENNSVKKLKNNELVCVKGLVKSSNDTKQLKLDLNSINVLSDNTKQNKITQNTYSTRTHNCGELRFLNIGEKVTMYGWLQYQRVSKFLILRDSYGMTQCVVPDNASVENIPLESILKITGTVSARPVDMINPSMATGEVEVLVEKFEVLNVVADIPFTLRKHQKPKEQLRLQYRYLDLRYDEMQNNLRLRSQMLHNMRKFLIERNSFVEVETPTLFCRTPGGAREFIVPTHNSGLFYSLVQSPQQFKQMLMVGGVDRYFQIARCYRDEATRPDRQPEFTQLDIELSFTTVQGIFKLVEDLLYATYPMPLLKPPYRQINYRDSLETYGSDKPDLSYDVILNNVTLCIENTNAVSDFASYTLILPRQMNKLSCKVKDAVKNLRKRYPRVQVLDYYKLPENVQNKCLSTLQVKASKTLFVAAGPNDEVCLFLGEVRTLLADEMESRGLLKKRQGMCEPVWVVNFPLFTRGENGKLDTCHHPFTAPHPEDVNLLDSDPLKVRSLAYDLVINGNEVAGGSIRVHNPDLQIKLLNMLNIDTNTMEYFVKALRCGCPPHGGIALGIDRLMALACNAESIRDVIAFPKSHEGRDPLSGAPHCISESDKDYYHLTVRDGVEKKMSFNNNELYC